MKITWESVSVETEMHIMKVLRRLMKKKIVLLKSQNVLYDEAKW